MHVSELLRLGCMYVPVGREAMRFRLSRYVYVLEHLNA